MKKILKTFAFIGLIFSLVGCSNLKPSTNNKNDSSSNSENIYTKNDVLYVNKKDSTIVTVNGRGYYKNIDGYAAVVLANINGYTGPILISNTKKSIQYYYKYSGTNLVDDYITCTIDDQEWYVSKNEGFMAGNYLDFSKNIGVYCSKNNTLESIANEVIPLIDKTKFEANFIKIKDAEGLKALENSSSEYVLGDDIDLSSEEWTPIKNFTGSLNGKGHTISGLTINISNQDYSGLFETVSGEITNLKLENISIQGRYSIKYIGGITGYLKSGAINNCEVDGNINCPSATYVGGIVGYSETTEIDDCINNADVEGFEHCGGICGRSNHKYYNAIIENLENNGQIKGINYVGGIYGSFINEKFSNSTIHSKNVLSSLKNTGSIIGENDYVGGICGYCEGFYYSGWGGTEVYVEIEYCENEGEIKGNDCVGGIIGKSGYYETYRDNKNSGDVIGNNYCGGILGYSKNSTIQSSSNSGTITFNAVGGGIAGRMYRIDSCKNTGNINPNGYILENNTEMSSYSGGIVGRVILVNKCINEGTITLSQEAIYCGGIAGYCNASGNIENNKNNGDILAPSASYVGGIIGYFHHSEECKLNGNENYALINGKSFVGGIIGSTYITSSTYGLLQIMNSLNEGEINGESYVGGIGGYIEGRNTSNMCSIVSNLNSGDVNCDNSNTCGFIAGKIGSYITNNESMWKTNKNTGGGKASSLYN